MPTYGTLKPVFDAILAFLGLILALPAFALIAAAVRLSSAGPIIFRQVRVGRGGRQFTIYKFRTMYAGAENDRDMYHHLDVADGPAFKIPDDPRLTRAGRFLSRTFLDELPQLYNILRGDMSFVGPRPPTPDEVPHYEDWQRKRLSVKPGLTSPWAVNGRHNLTFEEWMRSDIEYIGHMDFLTDLGIIARTVALTVAAVLGR
jgi:lipopolysaccharide/colanic/teichoic acid biosynthesis glycosyltransferase